MGAGICTLASEIPENRELIGDTGFTFVPGDVNDLERMLRLLIGAPQIRESTGLHARERVRGLYQWDSITSEIRRIYLQLMNASPDPANAFVEPAAAEPRSGTDVAA
jgi:glycosyltransferase involved in cell wall biosynthesis